MLTTNSVVCLPGTSSGVFHDDLIPYVCQASSPVSLSSATAGTFGGSVNLTLVSNGTGTSGFAAFGLGTQVVNVSANVYRLATASAARVRRQRKRP